MLSQTLSSRANCKSFLGNNATAVNSEPYHKAPLDNPLMTVKKANQELTITDKMIGEVLQKLMVA